MKILIVDDEKLMRELLVDVFESEGHSVRSAQDGVDALSVYQEFSPEVIVLDVMMPGIDGFEVCRKIRNDFADKETCIYLLTGMGGNDLVVRGREQGANKVLFKPISNSDLINIVAS